MGIANYLWNIRISVLRLLFSTAFYTCPLCKILTVVVMCFMLAHINSIYFTWPCDSLP